VELLGRFLQERTYFKGVSPETLRYYRWVRRAFSSILAQPTKAGMLMEQIQRLRAYVHTLNTGKSCGHRHPALSEAPASSDSTHFHVPTSLCGARGEAAPL